MAYFELVGRWITGPLDPTVQARVPIQISWPQLESGTISLVLKDQNDAPVDLNLSGGDSATLSIGIATDSGALTRFDATAQGEVGRFTFTIPVDSFRDLSGPLIYDVTVIKGTDRQAVLPLAYWILQATAFSGT